MLIPVPNFSRVRVAFWITNACFKAFEYSVIKGRVVDPDPVPLYFFFIFDH